MSGRGYPYVRPTRDTVRPARWVMHDAGGDRPLPDHLPDWDYATDLTLSRSVTVDVDAMREQIGVEAADLSVDVAWRGPGLFGRGGSARLPSGATATVEVTVALLGRQLGGTLTVQTLVTLARDRADAERRHPRRVGAALWSDVFSTRLQGDAPRMPMAAIDMHANGFPAGAPWVLDVGHDLLDPALGAIHMLLNAEEDQIVFAAETAANPDDVSMALLQSMRADAGRVMIDRAVGHPDFSLDDAYPDDSLGDALQALVRRVFGRTDLSGIRGMRDDDPSAYSATVLAALRTAST